MADFRAVYEQELDYVFHTLRRLGVPPEDLEDVTHDCFIAVYKHFADYDQERPLRPWLFGFAFRFASDHRKLARHRHTSRLTPSKIVAVSPLPGPDALVEEEQLRQAMLAALDALSFERRSLIVMHDLEGMGAPDIARLTEVPVNTVYSRLRLARAELEEHLEKLVGGPRG